MASTVLGVGTAHTPLLILPPETWDEYAARDRDNPELVFPPDGLARGFDDAVATVVPAEVRDRPRDVELYRKQSAACQDALDELAASLERARPDAVVIVSDDQDEWFYDANMPSLAVYWGDSVPIVPRPDPTAGSARDRELTRLVNTGYAAERVDVPVDAALGRHLVEHLVEHDFDVTSMTYVEEDYGGRVGRRYPAAGGGELGVVRRTARRPVGLPHGYSFVVQRLLSRVDAPIVPVIQNTCYPPNAVSPRRSVALGEALAAALRDWRPDARVAVVASGGLSHFVVDEELDRSLLAALGRGDRQALLDLPRHRLRSATSECLNWVALGALMGTLGTPMELVGYEPVYRTEAGTGAGLGFGRWLPPTA